MSNTLFKRLLSLSVILAPLNTTPIELGSTESNKKFFPQRPLRLCGELLHFNLNNDQGDIICFFVLAGKAVDRIDDSGQNFYCAF
jgi:hypothetical protein